MKRIMLAVAAAFALLVGPALTSTADAQYRYYRSYRPAYGGYYSNSYYRPYYNNYYGGSYYRPYTSGYRGYYGGYGGYGGWGGRGYYQQPGVYIGGRGFGVGIGF